MSLEYKIRSSMKTIIRRVPQRSAGLSVVELMIAITLGLLILAGLTTLFTNTSSARSELEKSSRQIENGRFAVQLISDDIQHAGYYGDYYDLATPPAALPNPCATDVPTLGASLPFPVQGYDAFPDGADPIPCLSDLNHLGGTDILVIRRAATQITPAASVMAGEIYMQTTSHPPSNSANNYVLGPGSTPFVLTKKDGAAADIRRFHMHIYFVSPCSVPKAGVTCSADNSDDGGRSIPTLKRIELTGGAMTIVPLVEGIENFQVDYGIDNDPSGSTGSGAPEGVYVRDPNSAAAWANVAALRVHLLARNTEHTPGYVDSKTYGLGSAAPVPGGAAAVQTTTPGGIFKRQVYSTLVRPANISQRREIP